MIYGISITNIEQKVLLVHVLGYPLYSTLYNLSAVFITYGNGCHLTSMHVILGAECVAQQQSASFPQHCSLQTLL